jgi:hypothetical protein
MSFDFLFPSFLRKDVKISFFPLLFAQKRACFQKTSNIEDDLRALGNTSLNVEWKYYQENVKCKRTKTWDGLFTDSEWTDAYNKSHGQVDEVKSRCVNFKQVLGMDVFLTVERKKMFDLVDSVVKETVTAFRHYHHLHVQQLKYERLKDNVEKLPKILAVLFDEYVKMAKRKPPLKNEKTGQVEVDIQDVDMVVMWRVIATSPPVRPYLKYFGFTVSQYFPRAWETLMTRLETLDINDAWYLTDIKMTDEEKQIPPSGKLISVDLKFDQNMKLPQDNPDEVFGQFRSLAEHTQTEYVLASVRLHSEFLEAQRNWRAAVQIFNKASIFSEFSQWLQQYFLVPNPNENNKRFVRTYDMPREDDFPESSSPLVRLSQYLILDKLLSDDS